MSELYAGLMSGTSLDGVDAVLVSFDTDSRLSILRTGFIPYPDALRAKLVDLLDDPRPQRAIAREVDLQLGELYATAVLQLLEHHSKDEICAVGCHGQTILHEPTGKSPFSWQAGDARTLANRTGLPVIDDFRSADMVGGGQGAPLAPAFHQYAFSDSRDSVAVINIGGIANVTYLPTDSHQAVIGFDTGPGNALSDHWTRQCKSRPYDKDGQWARSAQPDSELLNAFMQDEYFQVKPPKSLDTRYFCLQWLHEKIAQLATDFDAAVVQSTIAAFTAQSIWRAIEDWLPQIQRLVVCGGGAYNQAIMDQLAQRSALPVETTKAYGIEPDDVEACAFAWLARQRMHEIPGNLPSVTGARERVLLGSITDPN